MNLLTCITVLLVLSGVNSRSEDLVVPQEFRGVWKIVAATDNGADRPLAEDPDGGLSAGECGMLEVIICEARIIIVETDGDAMVGWTKILGTKPHTKIEWTGFGYHAKQDGPSFVVLKRVDENTIQFALCEKDADNVDASIGGRQFVLTATR